MGYTGCMSQVSVLGVKIDDVSLKEATELVTEWLNDRSSLKKRFIATPNPEFLVQADSNPEFKKVLNRADLAIPDGVGLKISGRIKNTTTGVDLMEELCQAGNDLGFSIGLIGGRDRVAIKTKDCLQKRYPKLKIVFAEGGPEVDGEGNGQSTNSISKVDILFVAFGMIKQELWINKNLENLPVKIAMGVGGAFDYLSGQVPRAPKLLRQLGLEWLFRLIIQPWRIKRQLALIKFVYLMSKRG